MTLNDIDTRLIELNIPVCYQEFLKPVSPPYLAYYETSGYYDGADYQNLIKHQRVRIELYCKNKSVDLEKQVEALFFELELEKDEVWLSEEKLLMVTYEFEYVEEI